MKREQGPSNEDANPTTSTASGEPCNGDQKPTTSTASGGPRNEDEKPATSTASKGSRNEETEQFGTYVTQRLDRLPDDLKRRRLENAIQEAIVKAEKEALG